MPVQEEATCCRVSVGGEEFGFCTLMRLIQEEFQTVTSRISRYASQSENGIRGRVLWRKPGMNTSPESVSSLLATAHDDYDDDGNGGESDVIFIDLFAVPCNPPLDQGLCSQYVSLHIAFP